MHFFPVALFRQKLHRGLEAVDIQAQSSVSGRACVFPSEAIIPNNLTHNRTILLLHKTLISFLVRPSSGKGDVFLFTIRHHYLIDEFSSVIGINV